MVSGGPFPGWTGPRDDRRSYYVENRTDFRSGGLGVVYRATTTSWRIGLEPGTVVAVKMFTGDVPEDRFAKLMERSVALREVNHPRLAHLLEVFVGPPFVEEPVEEDEAVERYCVHAWIEGEPLADVCLSASPAQVLQWGREVAEGLDHLHTHPAGPFAHRDIHPRNILITSDGNAVLIDYDTILVDGRSADRTAVLLHSTRFAPAEPAAGIGGAQHDDRWSLARTLLFCLARDPLSELRVADACVAAQAALSDTAADPEGVVACLRAVLDGEDPRSALELMTHLDRPLRHRRFLPRVAGSSATRRPVIGGLVGAGVLAIGALAFALIGQARPPSSSYRFSPEVFQSLGLIVYRTWTLGGDNGTRLEEQLTFVSSEAVSTTYDDVIPAQVTTALASIDFQSHPRRIARESHIVQYRVNLAAGEMLTRTYVATISPGGGSLSARLARLARDELLAERSWLEQSGTLAPAVLTALTIDSKAMLLSPGQTSPVPLTGTLSAGQPATPQVLADVAWSSSDPAVASVTKAGVVIAKAPGQTEIVAQSGPLNATIEVTVQGTPLAPNTTVLSPDTTAPSRRGESSSTSLPHVSTPTTTLAPTTTTTSLSPAPPQATTYAETTGSVVHTWTDYENAGGTEGPEIPSNDTVQVTCRVQGYQVADGNTWWYEIASSPWSNTYYGSADAFYNNGETTGSLQGTPFYDPNVPVC